jgi:two-component system cell cycle response regulator DivK
MGVMIQARILLIEDSSTYAELATMLLTRIGCTVTRASTAEDGLRMAREETPDLILMDINLPGMDGFQAVRVLRQDPRTRQIPTVGLTGDRVSSEEEHLKAREAGFDAYAEKPIDSTRLRDIVEPLLGWPPHSVPRR